jgi:hypothetical protein
MSNNNIDQETIDSFTADDKPKNAEPIKPVKARNATTQKKATKKPSTKAKNTSEVKLAVKNRFLTCIHTGKEIAVYPERYEALYNIYGSEEEVAKNFLSKEAEVFKRENPVQYALLHSKRVIALRARLAEFIYAFNNIPVPTSQDVLKLQSQVSSTLASYDVPPNRFKALTDRGKCTGIEISLPLVSEKLIINV